MSGIIRVSQASCPGRVRHRVLAVSGIIRVSQAPCQASSEFPWHRVLAVSGTQAQLQALRAHEGRIVCMPCQASQCFFRHREQGTQAQLQPLRAHEGSNVCMPWQGRKHTLRHFHAFSLLGTLRHQGKSRFNGRGRRSLMSFR